MPLVRHSHRAAVYQPAEHGKFQPKCSPGLHFLADTKQGYESIYSHRLQATPHFKIPALKHFPLNHSLGSMLCPPRGLPAARPGVTNTAPAADTHMESCHCAHTAPELQPRREFRDSRLSPGTPAAGGSCVLLTRSVA